MEKNMEKIMGKKQELTPECKILLNKLSSDIPQNDNSNIKIIQVNNKYLNLDTLKKQKQDYKNLLDAGFNHGICIWEYLGLTKEEYKAIRNFYNRCI